MEITKTLNTNYTDTAYISFVLTLQGYDADGSKTLLFKNGLFTPNLTAEQPYLIAGDIISYIVDPLITNKYNQSLSSLNGYKSSLDSANKVIYSIDLTNDEMYVADQEFFISGALPSGERIGCYFPRLSPSFIRELTNKDYGLHAGLLTARINELSSFSDVNSILSDINIHLIRRNTRQFKSIFEDTNSICDLMNLPANIRNQVLTGVNSNLYIWTASVLEGCPYNTWIALPPETLSTTSITGVYGRTGALQYLEGVQKHPGFTDWYMPPLVDINGGNLLSYDANGLNPTITNYTSSYGNIAYPDGQGYELFLPVMVDVDSMDITVAPNDSNPTIVLGIFGFLCYYVLNGSLTVATLNVDYTVTVAGNNYGITWSQNTIPLQRFVRLAKNYVNFNLPIAISDIRNGIDIYNGKAMANDIGMGNLSVWLNGHYLIEGLDFNVTNSKIYIVSQGYLTDTGNTLFVLYAGVPSNTVHIPNTIWGFVELGKILNDNKYDLLMYRNYRFYVNGAAIRFSDINAKENYVDEIHTTPATPFIDGKPYAIVPKPQFIPNEILNIYTETVAAETLRNNSVVKFLTTIDEQPLFSGTVTIPSRYVLVSPFMDKLIEDIKNGIFQAISSSSYNDNQVIAMVTSYLPLLIIDPVTQNIDPGYAIIIPTWETTPVSITANQYSFLNKVNSLILNENISNMNIYLTVSG